MDNRTIIRVIALSALTTEFVLTIHEMARLSKEIAKHKEKIREYDMKLKSLNLGETEE